MKQALLQAVKNLPTADSGMICFNNNDYDQLARKLSWLGIDKDTYQRTKEDGVYKGSYKWEYDVIDAGYKYHGNSIMAGMAIVGLKYLEEDNSRRREICKMYENGFDSVNMEYVKVSPSTHTSSRHLFQIVVKNRDKIMEYLNSQKIYPGVHYRDNTLYSLYSDQAKNCPKSRNYSESIISLPLHMQLSDNDVQYVIEKVVEANKMYNL
jgi:dTDP-4-amino-4,6-dideoxygalactose transaminase